MAEHEFVRLPTDQGQLFGSGVPTDQPQVNMFGAYNDGYGTQSGGLYNTAPLYTQPAGFPGGQILNPMATNFTIGIPGGFVFTQDPDQSLPLGAALAPTSGRGVYSPYPPYSPATKRTRDGVLHKKKKKSSGWCCLCGGK